MTTIAMRQPSLPDAISTALFELLKCGFGHVDCVVHGDAELEHQQTELTYRPRPGESSERFIDRLMADPPWRGGDQLSFSAKRDHLDLVRIRRFPAHASDVIAREPDESLDDFADRLERIVRNLRTASRVADDT